MNMELGFTGGVHRTLMMAAALVLTACGGEDDGDAMADGVPSLTGLDPAGTDDSTSTGGPNDSGGGSSETGATTGPADDSTDGGGIKFDLGGYGSTGMLPADTCQTELMASVRDFSQSHPDFESSLGTDPGIVQPMLGGDGKPVYAGGSTGTTTGAGNFDQWYRDVGGVNITIPVQISLADQGDGTYIFDSSAFFPIDGQGFGDEGHIHNYHFTLELHTQFTYQGGEVFTFRGDDDLFTFINGRLGIDLGGVHGPLEGSIDLDAMAGELGIVPGGTYDLDFFFAERHTSESNFRIETTIGCFQPPG